MESNNQVHGGLLSPLSPSPIFRMYVRYKWVIKNSTSPCVITKVYLTQWNTPHYVSFFMRCARKLQIQFAYVTMCGKRRGPKFLFLQPIQQSDVSTHQM